MKLQDLLHIFNDYEIKGCPDTPITGISSNSKMISPGYLFIAKKGKAEHGSSYISEAVNRGACAILTDTYHPTFSILQVIHPNVASIEAELAARYYNNPSKKLFMVGITGTNGKTTTSFILQYLLKKLSGPCGLIGTIEYVIGDHCYPAKHTTPDVVTNHRLLQEMVQQECCSAVMEVSSHALTQGRVNKIAFDVAVFSNLTLDHLDYHHSMEEYCAAKSILFRQLNENKTAWAIVNQDCKWTPQILKGSTASVLSYGIDKQADLYAFDIQLSLEGTKAKIAYKEECYSCEWPLIGRFNMYNCLSAIGVMVSQGCSLQEIVPHMKFIPAVKGRLESVENKLGIKIYVDFAHSDDSLSNILQTIRECTSGRLFIVFGCGGDRDRSKRPKMAIACEKSADFCIVTSDNPRSENPWQIAQEICRGFTEDRYVIELDRMKAIQLAVYLATPGDTVIIAGKGHETQQIFAHSMQSFDDYQVATEICNRL
jgi:UDP-N-acetylmuramoyl-L-alanyl-D-glutamate--2,6-diaminopimelate ligase